MFATDRRLRSCQRSVVVERGHRRSCGCRRGSTVPPARTACNATGTSSPAGAKTTARSHVTGRRLGGVADPRGAELARELAVRAPRGQHHHLATPVVQHLRARGARTRRIPSNATRSPGCTSARRSARYPITPAHSNGAASRSSSASGSCTANASGTVTRVGVPAVDGPPGEVGGSHRFSSPRTQNAQSPQVRCSQATPTRSPTCGDSQPSPSASTSPPPGARARPAGAAARGRPRRRADRCGSSRTRHADAHLAGAGLGRGRSTSTSGPEPTGAGARQLDGARYSRSSRNRASSRIVDAELLGLGELRCRGSRRRRRSSSSSTRCR